MEHLRGGGNLAAQEMKYRLSPERTGPVPDIKLPPKGTMGPVHISVLMKPIREISKHHDRNRLLVEFFRENESGQDCFQ